MTTLSFMKPSFFALALSFVLLIGCSTTTSADKKVSDGETVLITYRVKPGSEAEFEQVLAEAWKTYRAEKLVFASPHIITSDKDGGGKPRFVEIFTWVSPSAPDHAPDSVKKIWAQMMSLCEKRDGHGGLEGGEVEIVGSPK